MIERVKRSVGWPLAIAVVVLALASVVSAWAVRQPMLVPSRHAMEGAYLRPRDHFTTVFWRLGGRVDRDPAALHALRHAALACSGRVSSNWSRYRNLSTSEKVFHRWQLQYCRGRSQAGWATAYATGEWIDLKQRHPNWNIQKGEKTFPPDFFGSVVRDAPPPDIRLVQIVLAEHEGHDVPWPFGIDVVAHSLRAAGLPHYQRMALRLLECDIVGGCGPRGVMTFELCREANDCAADLSTADLVRKRHSPEEVAIIETLHRRLLEQRRAYASSHYARPDPY
ncbi:MAG: hypothetical protein GAK28_02459 [Luteibacter sp.]|uniref:hypothetical protein n=1 Tax=Luteibacter sp. TaxID=1886636 RepID=UPI001383C561|nr:hypothetical protein [Luteibacter sp.]KAF1006441.1 MAG: hypothetical protein GAK28_02459 [Luteibacter sp.]